MISVTDKVKITGYIKKTPKNKLSYPTMIHILGHSKYSYKDFIDYFLASIKSDLLKDTIPLKITEKFVLSVTSIIEWYVTESENIDYSLKNQIDALYMLYGNLLNKNPDLENSELTTYMGELETKSCELFIPQSTSETPNSSGQDTSEKLVEVETLIKEYETKIKELVERITELNQHNSNKDKRNRGLQKEITELETKISALQKELEDSLVAKETIEIEHSNLNNAYGLLLKRLENINKRLNRSREEINRLSNQYIETKSSLEIARAKIVNLEAEIARRDRENTVILEQEEEKRRQAKENTEIDEIILSYLCRGTYTAKKLVRALVSKGYNITGSELYEHIRKLKQKVNIETSAISLGEPKYQIAKPPFKVGGDCPVIVPRNTEFYDVVFVADMHIDVLTPEFKDNYRRLLDYCADNNIKMIFNLGDFFDFTNVKGYVHSYDVLKGMEEKARNCVENLPTSPVFHAVLGGNHDRSNAYLGEDFLSLFIDERPDFLSLGFDWTKVIFEKSSNSKIEMLLAHPHREVPISSRTIFGESFKTYDFSYLGHSHLYFPNLERKYCKVISFSRSGDNNGFLHVRIYFNNRGLESLEFKPLTLSRKLEMGKITKYSPK